MLSLMIIGVLASIPFASVALAGSLPAVDAGTKNVTESRVRLVGVPGSSVEIFRATGVGTGALDPNHLLPLGTIVSGRVYRFPRGSYYAVNACSAVYFELSKDATFDVHLRRISFVRDRTLPIRLLELVDSKSDEDKADALWSDFFTNGDVGPVATLTDRNPAAPPLKERISVACSHPLSSVVSQWADRDEFEILPGQVSLTVAGRQFSSLVPSVPAVDGAKNVSIPLSPVLLRAQGSEPTDIFLSPVSSNEDALSQVVSAPLGGVQWLPFGRYQLEVNGSKREIVLDGKSGLGLSLGSIVIQTPADFPMQERIRSGGSPPFAYINSHVLFTLDTPYYVFPGRYTVSLEGGDVRADVEVFSGRTSRMQTLGSRILMPPCPAGGTKACKRAPRITIHNQQKPFVLMTVEPETPFLVLDGDYEYGVEGLRGILRKLPTSGRSVAEETLARVRFVWQIQPAAPRVRTDLVRLETLAEPVFGKSLDFLFHQPEEIYVPPGSYELTYFVGDPAAERKKIRNAKVFQQGSTVELVVPIYSDKASQQPPGQSDEQADTPSVAPSAAGSELPSQLKRIRK